MKTWILYVKIHERKGVTIINLQERVKKIRTEVASSPTVIAKELTAKGFKITDKTIYGYENGFRQPSVTYLEGLSAIYDANPMWLLLGKGEMFLNSECRNDFVLPENLDFNNIVFMPHIDLRASAGYGCLIDEINMTQDFIAFSKKWLAANIYAPLNELVMFTVNGDSMDSPSSQIKNGSLILVDKSVTEFGNDGIYVVSIDDALFVKRLQFLPGKKMRVKSDNPAYDPFDVSLETDVINIIGKVIWAGNKIDTLK